eukprot:s151_g2.t1
MPKASGLLCAAKFLPNLRPGWLPTVLSVTGMFLHVVLDLSGGRAWLYIVKHAAQASAALPDGAIFVQLDLSNAILLFLREHWSCIPVCASSCLILCGGTTNNEAPNKVEVIAQPCLDALWLRALNSLLHPGHLVANALPSLQVFFFCGVFGLLTILSFCSVAFLKLFISTCGHEDAQGSYSGQQLFVCDVTDAVNQCCLELDRVRGWRKYPYVGGSLAGLLEGIAPSIDVEMNLQSFHLQTSDPSNAAGTLQTRSSGECLAPAVDGNAGMFGPLPNQCHIELRQRALETQRSHAARSVFPPTSSPARAKDIQRTDPCEKLVHAVPAGAQADWNETCTASDLAAQAGKQPSKQGNTAWVRDEVQRSRYVSSDTVDGGKCSGHPHEGRKYFEGEAESEY